MGSIAGACLLVAGFLVLFKLFGLAEKALEAIQIAKRSLADIRNTELDDYTKEKALQGYSKRLFALFFVLTIKGFAALLIPAALVLLLEKLGFLVFDSVLETTLSWPFLVITSVAIMLFLYLWRRLR